MIINVTPLMAFVYVIAAFLFAANEYLKTSKKFKELSEETKQDYDNKKLAAEVEKLTNKKEDIEMAIMNRNKVGARPGSVRLTGTEESQLILDKVANQNKYNGYYPNIKKVDMTVPRALKHRTLVMSGKLTIELSSRGECEISAGNQSYFDSVLRLFRIDKSKNYGIPEDANIQLLEFRAEEDCYYYDAYGEYGSVTINVEGSRLMLPSSCSRKSIVESISLLYPYVEFKDAYYDNDTHTYYLYTKSQLLNNKSRSKRVLLSANKMHSLSTNTQFAFADSIKATTIDASQFKVDVGYSKFLQSNPGRPFSDSSTESVTDYYLGSDEPIKEKKKVVAREWFFGIEETEEETKARYKIQEKNMVGWDDF